MEPASDPTKILNGARVLVLDDDEGVQQILLSSLGRCGCTTAAYEDGRKGLHALLKTPYDIVILDLQMPGMDGLTFLREARKIWPWLGVLVESAYIDNATREALLRLQVHEILEKPFPLNQLLAATAREMSRLQKRLQAVAPVPFDQVQRQLAMLRHISDTALHSTGISESMKELSRGLGDLLRCDVVGILILGEEERKLAFHVRNPYPKDLLAQLREDVVRQASLLSGNHLTPESLQIQTHGHPLGENAPAGPGSTFTVPIMIGEHFDGVLVMASAAADAFTATDISLVYHTANHLSTTLAALQGMRQLAIRDSLTGLYNRRFLQETMDPFWSSSQRHQQELSVAILDVDHFKSINDSFGHHAGDRILTELAALTRKVCRTTDIVARYGGDEVVIVMPQTPLAAAETFARRLLEGVRKQRFQTGHDPGMNLTISIGLAGSLSAGPVTDWETLFTLADRALYAAKKQGRDCSRTFHPATEVPATGGTAGRNRGTVFGRGRILLLATDDADGPALRRALAEADFRVELATQPEEAEQLLANQRLHDLVLISQPGPPAETIQLCGRLRRQAPGLPCILVVRTIPPDADFREFLEGATDFLLRPWTRDDLLYAVERILHRVQTATSAGDEAASTRDDNAEWALPLHPLLQSAGSQMLELIADLIDLREQSTGRHGRSVREVATFFGRQVGLPESEIDKLACCALLHDVGKLAIPDSILLKRHALNPEETRIMRSHVETGYRALRVIPALVPVAELVYQHHEAFDGSGYPRGLKGDEIARAARVFSLIDTYDAMRSNRAYRPALPPETATDEIRRCSGSQFDPELARQFLTTQAEIEQLYYQAAPTATA